MRTLRNSLRSLRLRNYLIEYQTDNDYIALHNYYTPFTPLDSNNIYNAIGQLVTTFPQGTLKEGTYLFGGVLCRNLQLCAVGKRGTGGCEEDGNYQIRKSTFLRYL